MFEIRELTNPYFTAHFVGGPLHNQQQEPIYTDDLMPETIKVGRPMNVSFYDGMAALNIEMSSPRMQSITYVLTRRNEKIGIYVESGLLARLEQPQRIWQREIEARKAIES